MFISSVANRVVFLAAICFIALTRPAQAAGDSLSTLISDRLTVAWAPDNGLTISIDNVPFVRRSSLAIVKPGWTGIIFNQPAVKPQITDWMSAPDGAKTARITLENSEVVCHYTLSVSPKNSVSVDLGYQLPFRATAPRDKCQRLHHERGGRFRFPHRVPYLRRTPCCGNDPGTEPIRTAPQGCYLWNPSWRRIHRLHRHGAAWRQLSLHELNFVN